MMTEFLKFFKEMSITVDGKIEEDGTFSAKINAVPKEIELIDISRAEEKKPSFKKDLSEAMLQAAFGEDFDTEVGKPKVVR